jgi:transposase
MVMIHFVGRDVSVKEKACRRRYRQSCVRTKRADKPDEIVKLLASIGEDYGRIGIEAGLLSQWLVNGL